MRYVICLRNPVDVAASLKARKEERVPLDQGVDLWFTYVQAALSATAGHPREFVFYEDVMADPEPVVGRLARFIGTPPRTTTRGGGRASRSARAHRGPVAPPDRYGANVVDAGGIPFHVKALYLALRQFVPSAESVETEVLDLVGRYADSAGRRLTKLAADRDGGASSFASASKAWSANEAELPPPPPNSGSPSITSSRRSSTGRGPSCGGWEAVAASFDSRARSGNRRGCSPRRRRGPVGAPRSGRRRPR